MADKLYELNDIEIMSVGKWNGENITGEDLDDMVDSFGKDKTGFVPFVKLGHDPKQKFANGLPRVGDIANIKRVGEKLVANLKNIPESLYNAIKRRNYNNVSSEIFYKYKNNGNIFRRVLKAIAFLGADIPAVNNLEELASLYTSDGDNFENLVCYSYSPKDAGTVDIREDKKMAEGGKELDFALPDKFSDTPWGSVDKSQLPMGCFLYVGDSALKETWKLPVYEGMGSIDPNTGMHSERGKLNINAIKAAYAALKGARGGVDIPDSARASIMQKIEGWLKEAGIAERGEEEMEKHNTKDKEGDMPNTNKEEFEKKILELSQQLEESNSKTLELIKEKEELAKKAEEFVALSSQVKALSDAVELTKTENAKLKEQQRIKDNEAWIKEYSSEGKNFSILPAEKEKVEILLDRLSSHDEMLKKFSHGDKETSVVDLFKEFISSRNLSNMFTDVAKDTRPSTEYTNAGLEVDKRVKEYMKGNRDVDYGKAFSIILDSDNELKSKYYASMS